ncbi:MAG: hypothetical protein CSA07_02080 [Bacteroidia bacterium]|nr:MAG: hypothetical protein CSA07_02080 [Bacteroidia bacterium]
MRVKSELWCVAAGLSLLLTGCGGKEDGVEAGAQDGAEVPRPVVEVGRPVALEYAREMSYEGTTFASREANLGAGLPGRVERINYEVGDRVPTGALVAELSDELLLQTQIEYQTLKKDYERLKRLEEKGSVPAMTYDHVKAQYEAAAARMEMVRSSTQIRAPFSGILAERMMEEGEVYFINPGLKMGYSMRSGIVRLMRLDPMVVRVEVGEEELADLRPGMGVRVSLRAFEGLELEGRIRELKPMLSTLTHTATVEAEFPNPRHRVLPGMCASVRLSLPRRRGLAVPLQSLVKEVSDQRDYVYLVNADSAIVRHEVELVQTLGQAAVVRGITGNSLVLTEGKGKIKPGQKVAYVEVTHPRAGDQEVAQ